jgi:hypothetical protein
MHGITPVRARQLEYNAHSLVASDKVIGYRPKSVLRASLFLSPKSHFVSPIFGFVCRRAAPLGTPSPTLRPVFPLDHIHRLHTIQALVKQRMGGVSTFLVRRGGGEIVFPYRRLGGGPLPMPNSG